MALFPHLVGIVVLLGSKKQMSRLYARWIVASMQNVLSVAQWPLENQPTHAMGKHWNVADGQAAISI
jgi:hypothetical protein